MDLDVDLCCSIVNGGKTTQNEESKIILLKWLSNPDVDRVGIFNTTKEILDRLQYLHGGEIHETTKEVDEPCFSSSDPQPVKATDN